MKQVQDLQHQLKVELLTCTDLENNNVILKEELASIKQVFYGLHDYIFIKVEYYVPNLLYFLVDV